MILRRLSHLEPHADSNIALVAWYTQHTETRLVFDALVNSSVAHKRIPGLFCVLLRCLRIYIWYLTARAPSLNVNVE